MIRTVTGDVEAIHGRILPHEHLQIDLSARRGPPTRSMFGMCVYLVHGIYTLILKCFLKISAEPPTFS